MEVVRFGLGIRFDMVEKEDPAEAGRRFWEEIFSVLTVAEVAGLHVFGGVLNHKRGNPGQSYLCVFTGGGLKQMRRIYRKLDNDAGVNMYLSATRPYVENNALYHTEGLTYYGKIHRDGTLAGGDAPLYGVRIHKKHGKKRPMGKGIRFLIAPDAFGEDMPPFEAVKRLTIAARRQFPGVRILPLPIAYGGPGTVASLLSGSDGAPRAVSVTSLYGGGKSVQAVYGAIRGTVGVLEAASTFDEPGDPLFTSSYGLGELIRRALDEGLQEILIGVDEYPTLDGGLGCLKALGVKVLDGEGKELKGTAADLLSVRQLDTELLHPRLKDATLTMLYPGVENLEPAAYRARVLALTGDEAAAKKLENALPGYIALLESAFALEEGAEKLPGAGVGGGLGLVLQCALGAAFTPGVGALLDTAKYDKRMREISLVITGGSALNKESLEPGQALYEMTRRCARHKVPLAAITGRLEEGAQEALFENGVTSVVCLGASAKAGDIQARLDAAAERMFRFVRIGREIERVTALKRKKK